MSSVNEESLLNSLASIEKDNNIKDMYHAYQYWLKQIGHELNRPLTFEENKLIKASFYATVYDKNN